METHTYEYLEELSDDIGARREVLGGKADGGGEQGEQQQYTTKAQHQMVRVGIELGGVPRRAGPGSFRGESHAHGESAVGSRKRCD